MSEETKTPEQEVAQKRGEELTKLVTEIWGQLDGCTVAEINAIAQSLARQAQTVKVTTK